MVSEKTERRWKENAQLEKEEREKVIDFILFLMEKYDLDGINPLEIK